MRRAIRRAIRMESRRASRGDGVASPPPHAPRPTRPHSAQSQHGARPRDCPPSPRPPRAERRPPVWHGAGRSSLPRPRGGLLRPRPPIRSLDGAVRSPPSLLARAPATISGIHWHTSPIYSSPLALMGNQGHQPPSVVISRHQPSSAAISRHQQQTAS
jgi:hypothetical protein